MTAFNVLLPSYLGNCKEVGDVRLILQMKLIEY